MAKRIIDGRRELDRLREVVNKLPLRDRVMMKLLYASDFSLTPSEKLFIADKLEIKIEVVESRLQALSAALEERRVRLMLLRFEDEALQFRVDHLESQISAIEEVLEADRVGATLRKNLEKKSILLRVFLRRKRKSRQKILCLVNRSIVRTPYKLLADILDMRFGNLGSQIARVRKRYAL